MTNEEELIASGFRQAKEITKECARTFYAASYFLPEEKKRAAYAIYAICRLSDESVDGSGGNLTEIRHDIEAAYGTAALNDPLLCAFRKIISQYAIPREYFDELIKGMEMDLVKNRYENFAELHLYCYRAAGVVGLIMLKLFGAAGQQLKECAVDLGIAMQLTNIVRDIKEDFSKGRIYLPLDELHRYGVSEDDIAGAVINNNFKALLNFQICRARQYYRNSDAGIRLIPGLGNRLTVLAIRHMYCGILDAVENNRYDVFNRRAYVGKAEKAFAILKILFGIKFI